MYNSTRPLYLRILKKSYGNYHINTTFKINFKTKFPYVSNVHLIQLVSKILANMNTGDDDDIDNNLMYSKILKNGRYHQSNEYSFMNYI